MIPKEEEEEEGDGTGEDWSDGVGVEMDMDTDTDDAMAGFMGSGRYANSMVMNRLDAYTECVLHVAGLWLPTVRMNDMG